MKTYEIVTDDFGDQLVAHEGDSKLFIPMVEGNRHYAEYLRYTEWVEAGNNPEDFWTRLEAGDN